MTQLLLLTFCCLCSLQKVSGLGWQKAACNTSTSSIYVAASYPYQALENQSGQYEEHLLPVNDSVYYARLYRKAKWAKWLGIGGLVGLIIPFVNLLSLPAAITSLILGGQVRRHTDDEELEKDVAKGKLASTVTIVFLSVVAAISILVIYLGSRGVR